MLGRGAARVRTGQSRVRCRCVAPLVAIALAGALGGGCSSEDSDRIGILQVQVAGERELVLGIDACHAKREGDRGRLVG